MDIVYYYVFCFLILITPDFHIQIRRIPFFLPAVPEIIKCGITQEASLTTWILPSLTNLTNYFKY